MSRMTIHILEGLERGVVHRDLAAPVTIGREEDNTIQLNDERVSRFHAKIQCDHGHWILTDLDSTNGTRVNGHPTQIRVLHEGDVLQIGRCLLAFGELPPTGSPQVAAKEAGSEVIESDVTRGDADIPVSIDGFDPDLFQSDLFPDGPPELPMASGTLHQAQLADVLAYAHERLSKIIAAAVEDEQDDASRQMQFDWTTWQRLLDLHRQMAVYLKQLGSPPE